MYFDTKSYLKNTRNYTAKHALSIPIVAPIERGLCNELHARVRDVTIGYPDTIFVHGILTCVHKLFLLPLIIVILIHLNK
jgi:hypothetical protein